jgi:hypothetical protein
MTRQHHGSDTRYPPICGGHSTEGERPVSLRDRSQAGGWRTTRRRLHEPPAKCRSACSEGIADLSFGPRVRGGRPRVDRAGRLAPAGSSRPRCAVVTRGLALKPGYRPLAGNALTSFSRARPPVRRARDDSDSPPTRRVTRCHVVVVCTEPSGPVRAARVPRGFLRTDGGPGGGRCARPSGAPRSPVAFRTPAN